MIRINHSANRPAGFPVLVLVLSFVLSGCSVFFVEPPPKALPRTGEVKCTDGFGLPIVDTLAAAGLATLAVATATRPAGEGPGSSAAKQLLTLGAVMPAIVFTGSAAHGYWTVSDCRRLKERPLESALR